MGMVGIFWSATSEQIITMSQEGGIDPGWIEMPPRKMCDLAKAWSGLSFLFCGSAFGGEFPEGFIMGGTPLNPEVAMEAAENGEDIGRWFTSEQTKEIARFLDSLDRDKLHEKYDPAKMDEEAYPAVFVDEGEEGFNWLYEAFVELRNFYRDAAGAGDCTVTLIC